MTESFVTIGSRNPDVKHVAGWLQVTPKSSNLRGYVSFKNGSIRSFSGGLVANDVPDEEVDKLILKMVEREESSL